MGFVYFSRMMRGASSTQIFFILLKREMRYVHLALKLFTTEQIDIENENISLKPLAKTDTFQQMMIYHVDV